MAWLDCKGSRHVKPYTRVTTNDDVTSDSSEEETLKQPNDLNLCTICDETKLKECSHKTKSRKIKQHKFESKLAKIYHNRNIFCLAVAICLLVFVTAILVLIHLSEVQERKQLTRPAVERVSTVTQNLITTPSVISPQKQTTNWEARIAQHFTEANIRLVDVDGDGLLDIIAATIHQVFVKITSRMKGVRVTKKDLEKVCHNEGMAYPCIGILMAYRGYDGKQLWVTPCRTDMFVINCDEFDINKDGKKDCIGAGRHGTLTGFDPYTGDVIWEVQDGTFLRTDWNTYHPRALPDWDGDGVPEILVVNGGAPIIPPNMHNRTAGRLIVFSGATGRQVGQRYLEIPQDKESYMSPVIYKSSSGSSYILFGSGGETVPGDLLGISVSDFCNYIMGSQSTACPVSEADVIWNDKVRDKYGIFVLFRFKVISEYIRLRLLGSDTPLPFRWFNWLLFDICDSNDSRRGVIVPPVIVDLNKDYVDDIVVNSFGGIVIALDGVNLRTLWISDFYGMESYSSPAPGYFDNDDFVDFMMHHNVGAWPHYSYSYTTIISGRDGSKLWYLRSNMHESTSDFSLRTRQEQRDIFVFRVKGRESSIMYNSNGNIVKSEDNSDISKIRKKRHTKDEDMIDVSSQPGDSIKLKIKAFKAEYDKSFMSCEMDLEGNTAEVFMIDRTTLRLGTRIKEEQIEKHRYNTSDDEEHCFVWQTQELTTGAIADVDGDGTLDYLSIVPLEGVKVNADYTTLSMEYVTKISKVNMFPHFDIRDRIHLHAETTVARNIEEKYIEDAGLLPPVQQQWTQYMGNKGDSHYYSL